MMKQILEKPKRGRPKIYTEDQLREHRRVYMLNKPWYCVCCRGMNNLAGKHMHLKTKKHERHLRERFE